ncbi:MAG: sugar phosphate isomerase/epimerase family protein [Desulfosarcinaceae bacterium]|nr:sugar phosphate isomerase/epimerase family protein [Desulfosarcinaceae bacterium]
MQYGAMNFPIRPIAMEIEQIAALGFDYLELAMDPPQAHYRLLSAQRPTIRALLDDHGLGLVCHMPTFVSTADLTDSIRQASIEEVLGSMDTAAELGARKIVLHPSSIMGMARLVQTTALERAGDALHRFVAHAAVLGIPLCLENMFPRVSPFLEAAQFAGLLDQFPDLMLTFDAAHAHIGDLAGRRLTAFLDRCGHRIGHVHLSDNDGYGDSHLTLGAGTLPLEMILKRLAALGYDDTITLEIFSEDKEELSASRRLLDRLWKAQAK